MARVYTYTNTTREFHDIFDYLASSKIDFDCYGNCGLTLWEFKSHSFKSIFMLQFSKHVISQKYAKRRYDWFLENVIKNYEYRNNRSY